MIRVLRPFLEIHDVRSEIFERCKECPAEQIVIVWTVSRHIRPVTTNFIGKHSSVVGAYANARLELLQGMPLRYGMERQIKHYAICEFRTAPCCCFHFDGKHDRLLSVVGQFVVREDPTRFDDKSPDGNLRNHDIPTKYVKVRNHFSDRNDNEVIEFQAGDIANRPFLQNTRIICGFYGN